NMNQNGIFTFNGSNTITISDPDAGIADVKVTIAVSHGTFALSQNTGLAISPGLPLTITGSLANINAALNGAKYTPTTDFTGSDTVAITVDDLGHTGTGGNQTVTFNVPVTVSTPTTPNAAPTITAPGSVSTNQNVVFTFN